MTARFLNHPITRTMRCVATLLAALAADAARGAKNRVIAGMKMRPGGFYSCGLSHGAMALARRTAVSMAEMQALIAERGDRPEAEMPVEFKQRVFSVLAKDHAKAVFFIFNLESELDQAMDLGDFELFGKKQLILASMELLEAELRAVMDTLMQEIEAATPESATEAKLHDLWTRVKAHRPADGQPRRALYHPPT